MEFLDELKMELEDMKKLEWHVCLSDFFTRDEKDEYMRVLRKLEAVVSSLDNEEGTRLPGCPKKEKRDTQQNVKPLFLI